MQLTTNSTAFIEAEQYSAFILQNLHDGLLGTEFYRNVADFGSGSTLNIKTVGTVTIQDGAENEPLTYSPIDSGTITLTITEHKGDAWYVTDDLREDGAQVNELISARGVESTRAIQEIFETDFLAAVNNVQVQTNPNTINGRAHRIISTETNEVFALTHLVQARLAMDKANVPSEGRVFICDPVVEATLNNLITITNDVTPFAKDILNKGLASGQRFVQSLYGFDILLSNRLPTGSFNDGTTTITDGVANLAMCVLDDQCKPVMGAWRRMPSVEGERNKDRARDEFVHRARYGFGSQRADTLVVIVTNATNIT